MSLRGWNSQCVIRIGCHPSSGDASAAYEKWQYRRAGNRWPTRRFAPRKVSLSLDRVRRRLHWQLVVGVGDASRLSCGLEQSRQTPGRAGHRAAESRLASYLQQQPHAEAWYHVGGRLGGRGDLCPQSRPQLDRYSAGADLAADRAEVLYPPGRLDWYLLSQFMHTAHLG